MDGEWRGSIKSCCGVGCCSRLRCRSSRASRPRPEPATAHTGRSLPRPRSFARCSSASSLRGLRGRGTTAAASGALAPCGKPTGVLCDDIPVPLDRSGVVPGTVSLHVEELPAQGVPRGVVFLIAGGPGQGSAHVYGLGDDVRRLALPLPLPRLHARRLRRPRHGRLGPARLPVAAASRHRRHRAGSSHRVRRAARRAARLLQHSRPCRRPRIRPPGARLRQGRAVRCLVRHQARDGLRTRAPGSRRAPPARLGAAARTARSLRGERAARLAGDARRRSAPTAAAAARRAISPATWSRSRTSSARSRSPAR